MPTKIENFDKQTLFDWFMFFLIVIVVLLFLPRGGGFIVGGVVGIGVGIVYNLTLKRVWAFAFPEYYHQYLCSDCKTVVGADAGTCPKCKVPFTGPEPVSTFSPSGVPLSDRPKQPDGNSNLVKITPQSTAANDFYIPPVTRPLPSSSGPARTSPPGSQFCVHCGNPIQQDHIFCENCGKNPIQ
jgi:RNA polymerase subunit RPABC4/transcription elongation factor Spt4